MSRLRLGARDRRALGLGALALAPALVFRFVVAPFGGAVEERRERLALERGLLTRELDLLGRAEGYPAELRRNGAALLEMAPRVFDGGEPMLVVDEAERYLERMTTLGPVLVEQLRGSIAEPGEAGLVSLHVEVKGRGDLEGILGVLRALEAGPKVAHVERLSLRKMNVAAEPGSGAYEVLSFALEVELFALAGDGPPEGVPEGRGSRGAAGAGR